MVSFMSTPTLIIATIFFIAVIIFIVAFIVGIVTEIKKMKTKKERG